jgi:nucleoside-diphosphate-sugar epimerase
MLRGACAHRYSESVFDILNHRCDDATPKTKKVGALVQVSAHTSRGPVTARPPRVDGAAHTCARDAEGERVQAGAQQRSDDRTRRATHVFWRRNVLSGEKILVTGPAGRIAFPLSRTLAANNEVWGIARFADADARERIESAGITTRRVDLASGDLTDLPRDFTYLLHIAADFSVDDYDRALRVNAEGTGFLLEHCRRAKGALVMSTVTTYKPHPDPWHRFTETDPLGDALAPPAHTYSISKIAEEAVARYCARSFDLPVTIARMCAAYGEMGGLAKWHLDAVAAGTPVVTRSDPMPYSPIHDDDIAEQLEPLLDAASVPATIVNWGGDTPVSVQQWSTYFGELLGVGATVEVQPIPGASIGSVADHTKRIAITGPCRVDWREGYRRMAVQHHPDLVTSAGS